MKERQSCFRRQIGFRGLVGARATSNHQQRAKGPRKNNYGIRGLLHPAQRRCSSVETSKVAPSSHLAGRAHQRSPSCVVILARTLSMEG